MTSAPPDPTAPSYGPSLPALLRPWLRRLGRWQRFALVLALLALVAVGPALVIRHAEQIKTYHQSDRDAQARGLDPFPFNFDYSRTMSLSHPPGTYVRIERRAGGTLRARFTVSQLDIGRQRGFVSGFLPIVATRYERQAAHSYPGFRLQFEGRARVNLVEGYQFAFTAQLAQPGRTARELFGRVVMLPEPFDHTDPSKSYPPGQIPTRGLLITMLATTLDNVPSATRVGDQGILQRPYRSFRFC